MAPTGFDPMILCDAGVMLYKLRYEVHTIGSSCVYQMKLLSLSRQVRGSFLSFVYKYFKYINVFYHFCYATKTNHWYIVSRKKLFSKPLRFVYPKVFLGPTNKQKRNVFYEY